MKRRIAAIAALTITLVAFAATPAYASWGGCSTSRVCTYWDSNGNGSVYYYTGPTNNTCIDIGEPWDNDISSVWNRFGSNIHARLYPWEGCSGVAIVVGPGEQIPDMSWWNDTASSMRIGPY